MITGMLMGDPISGAICEGLPHWFTRTVVSGTASSIEVPKGAYAARFLSLGSTAAAATYTPRWTKTEQLWNWDGIASGTLNNVGGYYTRYGITITRPEAFKYVITGTSTGTVAITWNVSIPANHKVLVLGTAANSSTNGCALRLNYSSGNIYFLTDSIQTLKSAATTIRLNIAINATCEDVIFRPNVFDLTDMFGEGNEPESVEEFETMFPRLPVAYDAGTTSMVAADTSGAWMSVTGGSFTLYEAGAQTEEAYEIEFIGRLTE